LFRSTIRANERTDVDAAIQRFQSEMRRSKPPLPDAVSALIVAEARGTLDEIVARGREVAALGSQMVVSRDISGEGYHVAIMFNAGKRSLLSRLVDAVRGK
jgi:hypothetical protein